LLSKNLKVKIYITIILPVFVYGCETWFLTFIEEQRLRACGIRMLRAIYGPKKNEVMEDWTRPT
jgi:hypothetical protein